MLNPSIYLTRGHEILTYNLWQRETRYTLPPPLHPVAPITSTGRLLVLLLLVTRSWYWKLW